MGAQSKVSKEDAVALVVQFMDYFKDGKYPPWSDPVWKSMSQAVRGRWTFESVYTNVKGNRRNIMTEAFEICNVDRPKTTTKVANESLNSALDDSVSSEELDDSYEFEELAKGLDEFHLILTKETWRHMIGASIQYGDGRFYDILQRDQWCDILSIIIFQQTRLPCAFMFHSSKIYPSPDSLHYCRITGHCSSRKCRNMLFCYLEKDPGDASEFKMIMRAKETFWDEHEEVYRPLKGIRRQIAGEKIYYQGAGNWQKQEAALYAQFGGFLGPNVPKMDILRKVKNEYRDKNLAVKFTDGKDVVLTIEKMKYTAPYDNFIHEVKRDKFYVSFSDHSQMHAYNRYCKIMKEKASPGVDGTGSLVKRIKRLNGTKSGHIFLCSITINYNGRTISVHDLLTESQDTDTIAWWLSVWLKLGATIPPQMMCDRSRALMNGICKAMNDQTISAYNTTLFLPATNNDSSAYRPPILTYIRNDVAHIINMVAKWKEFRAINMSTNRQFYLYCVALLIDCQSIANFQEIFSLLLTVGLIKSEGTPIKALPGGTVCACKARLLKFIATRQFSFTLDAIEETVRNSESTNADDMKDVIDSSNPVKDYIKGLREDAASPKELVDQEEEPLHHLSCPDFIDRLCVLAYEFPLWTAAALPTVVPHASTASTEGNFNDVKHRFNKNDPGLSRADKLIKRFHARNSSNAALLTSTLNHTQCSDNSTSTAFEHAPTRTHNNIKSATQKAKPQSFVDLSADSDTSDEENLNKSRKSESCSMFSTTSGKCPDSTKLSSESSNSKDVKRRKMSVQTESTGEDSNSRGDETVLKRKPANNKSKYFTAKPDIEHRSTLATTIHRQGFLMNANRRRGQVTISGKSFYSSNTCGFDSIVQILSGCIRDDPSYKSMAEKTDSPFFSFILKFIKMGATSTTYIDRTKLFHLLFPTLRNTNFEDCPPLSSTVINMFTSLRVLWEGCFPNDPSMVRLNSCTRCGHYDSACSLLTVNFKIIDARGFSHLAEALQFQFESRLVSCDNKIDKGVEVDTRCSESCRVEFKRFGRQILIELDVKADPMDKMGIGCKLEDMPQYITLKGREFRLAGVIGGWPGHFIAYCWCVNDSWDVADDTERNLGSCKKSQYVVPQGAVYVAISENTDEIPNVGDPTGEYSNCDPSCNQFHTPPPASTPPSPTASPIPDVDDANTTQQEHPYETPLLSDSSSRNTPPVMDMNLLDHREEQVQSTSRTQVNVGKCVYSKRKKDPDTLSTDNWRNKGLPDYYWVNDSVDEASCSATTHESIVLETPSHIEFTDIGPIPLIRSGSSVGPTMIDNQVVFIESTTNFDSLMHVLLCAVLDCPKYDILVEESSNRIIQFLKSVKQTNFDKSMYEERAKILCLLYSSKIMECVLESSSSAYILDTTDSLDNMWQRCFHDEPSVLKTFICETCGKYTIPAACVTIDQNLIRREGFTVLQKALQYNKELKKVKCRTNGCIKLCTVVCTTNIHLYIHLNVEMYNRAKTSIRCKIGDLPLTLDLGVQYRLLGVVAYHSDRFIAYCLRSYGS